MRHMRGLLFGAIGVAFVASASTASATLFTLNGPGSTGTFTASCSTSTTCSLTTSGVTGTTTPAGTYAFAGINASLDSCTAAGGCSTLVGGSLGTFTLNGTPFAISSLTLDGDGTGIDFIFSAPGLAGPNDITLNLNTSTTFTSLLAGAGTVTAGVSSGEANTAAAAPEPASLTLLGSALVGLGWLGRRRRKAM